MPAREMIRQQAIEMNNECRPFSSYIPKSYDQVYIDCSTDPGKLVFKIGGEKLSLDEVVRRNLPADIYSLLLLLLADAPDLGFKLADYVNRNSSIIVKELMGVNKDI